MKFRDIIKMRKINDGSRTLIESTMMPELIQALTDWSKFQFNGVLIGGLALSYHAVPRMTQDIDFLFLSENDIPDTISGFKRIRDHAFQHNKSHAEIEVLTPTFLKISINLVQKIIDTSIESNSIKIASASGIVALKLGRLSMRDKADIVSLLKTGQVSDLSEFDLPAEKLQAFHELVEIAKTDPHPN